MFLISALFSALQRLVGDVATTTVGWATVLLFGRIPQAQRRAVALMTLASLLWLLAVVCLVVPVLGSWLVSLIPRPGAVTDGSIQVVTVAFVVLLPLLLGYGTMALEERTPGARPLVEHLVRGYPLAAVLGATTVFLALLAVALKVRALQRGWEADHLPMIVKPGCYEAVAQAIETALREAGLRIHRKRAPWALTVPPRLIVAAGGGFGRHLVPDALAEFRGDGLWILVYPSDVALVGRKALVARARSAVAMRLTFAEAYLTAARESEQIEDRLADLSGRPTVSPSDFQSVDDQLASLAMPYDDWQTLYRLRLQVELQHDRAPAT